LAHETLSLAQITKKQQNPPQDQRIMRPIVIKQRIRK
jgi:hypothetical protein